MGAFLDFGFITVVSMVVAALIPPLRGDGWMLVAIVVNFWDRAYRLNSHGASIGQSLMGLKVVDERGDRLSLGVASKRWFGQLAIALVPFAGFLFDYLWPLWDDDGQTLHDKVASCYVVVGSVGL